MQHKKARVAIIAGASIANYLSAFDVDITLFEKQKSLVSGPPICHLHAGGNLYREISNEQCMQLLEESIELLQLYSLDREHINRIYKGWREEDVRTRAKNAIEYMAYFIPSFKDAEVSLKPLYGAQQIPGDDASLRAASVSFEGERYARCEIVKASSVLRMADAICKKLIALGYISKECYSRKNSKDEVLLLEESITQYVQMLSQERGYPEALGLRVNSGGTI
jgi:hypothetical protein